MKRSSVIFIIAALLILVASFALLFWNSKSTIVQCTMEAKLCPDGSYVGRIGPNCEFEPCPDENNPDDLWKTTTDSATGITFKYPEALLTQYIGVVDWPPKIQVVNESFSCTEAGNEIMSGGLTQKRIVDNRTYCVTKESGAAAGTTYTNYAYAFAHNKQTIILTFSLRAPNCDNYEDPQKTACKNEQQAFDLDSLIDRIALSMEFK
ncbi:MAG: hypothetical protein PHV78_03455 [Patescibacteria group bacterium]|nr:hypothetical protein [Patescibacteria group bacterium]MDD5121556.1 hypothetical protein [Patescibacteria group bacterium]MDD5222056.1 hypothetical protein [Patescibacteria group bacterium]MDD5396280.1 hypothetical protein [Patescibacteria group bacterium]